ncbi:hypothetical protein NLO413_0564 [Candidatus Neoehrlichia lotoris str. RAC413]|uniref:Uncharacterized protein n=2 Tax=Candidatus Neoehrlichia procyonis TaxID=467750 RepID=A0A0F3NNB8_9RICK|nr:hypothetical protein NLO413_0564 [Candidatus Neoehrlichia lotoris str. RAC413]
MSGWLYYYMQSNGVIEIKANIINLYVKYRLSSIFPGSEVSIQNTKLLWKKADENFILSASNIIVNNSDLGVKINIPKLSLHSRIGILFLWGDFDFAHIDVQKVNVSVYDIKKTSNFTITSINSIKSLKKYLIKLVKLSIPIHVQNLTIIGNAGESLLLDYLHIGIKKEYDSNMFSFTLGNNNSSFIQLTLSEHYKGVISLNMVYNNFNTRLLHFLGFVDKRLLLYDNIAHISGSLNIIFDEYDHIKYANVSLQDISGNIPCAYPSECHIDNLNAQLNYQDGLLTVKSFYLSIDKSNVTVNGELNVSSQDFNVDINANVINTKAVCNYWPNALYSKVKTWYCNSILDGNFGDVSATLHGNISNIKNIILNYNVRSHINNASIMINDHKSVKIVSGTLLLNNDNFSVSSNNASFQGINITEGSVAMRINDINAIMYIKGKAVSNVRKLYKIAADHQLLQLNENFIFGSADTKFNFKIFNLANNKSVYYSKDINSQITSFVAKKVLGSFDIDNSTVNVLINNNHVRVKVDGWMNGHDMSLNIIQDEKKAEKFYYKFSGYLSSDNIKNLKIFNYKDFQGKAKANVHWITNYLNTGDTLIEGNLDIVDFNLGKKYFTINSQNSSVKFLALLKNRNDIKLTYADVIGKDINIKLKGKMGKDVDLLVKNAKLFNTSVNASIKSDDGKLIFEIYGEFVDFSKVNFNAFFDKQSNTNNIRINMKVSNLLLKNNIVLHDVTLSLNCDNVSCIGSKLKGYFSDKAALSIEYSGIGLEITSENAGYFLRAFDVMNTIEKGHLSFYIHIPTDNKETYGMFSLTNFHVVNASILAQILTLSSLKGILNTLNGQGIYFYRLNVPFTYRNNLIKIQESWMEGSELGISLSGNVDVSTKVFDIKGQIIPAYVINKIIWQTPVIGKLLTGGQSRGIIAIDYKVKGNDKEHDVLVNLMSILAPNLLKRVLKVFDDRMLRNTKVAS